MKRLNKLAIVLASITTLAGTGSLVAPAFADGDMSEGEIRKIDKEGGKVTIKHGPLDNLEMPPMTMVFTVSDPTMLADFAEGDMVEFLATDEGGKLMVTDIQKNH